MEIQEIYQTQKQKIQKRLKEFKSLEEKSYFQEFLFCLLTPQSQAQKCWQAVEELSRLKKFTKNKVEQILKSKTRFHKTKTKRIIKALNNWDNIKSKLNNNTLELRDWLADNIDGLGMKESSHFLRNIGFSNNQIAILDRHILKNLKEFNLIKETKINSEKDYLRIEKIYLDFANSIGIPPDELDLLLWSKENGEIFK